MTLDQLRIFVAVAERLHFTKAAQDLNLTQSAVSAAVAALEAQHDLKLFDRLPRRIALTEAGAVFLPEARALLARAESAQVLLGDLAQTTRGRLRLHASQTVASYWLPGRMMALHEAYPHIDLNLTVSNTTHVAQAVLDGVADLGLVEGDVPHDSLHQRVVARDSLVLVMAGGHVWSTRDAVAPAEYVTQSWVLRETGSGTRSEFDKLLNAAGLSLADLTIAMEFPSNEAVLAAVTAGHSVSVLSRRAVESAAAEGTVRMLPVPGGERPFTVLTHPERHRTRSVEAMLDVLVQ